MPRNKKNIRYLMRSRDLSDRLEAYAKEVDREVEDAMAWGGYGELMRLKKKSRDLVNAAEKIRKLDLKELS